MISSNPGEMSDPLRRETETLSREVTQLSTAVDEFSDAWRRLKRHLLIITLPAMAMLALFALIAAGSRP